MSTDYSFGVDKMALPESSIFILSWSFAAFLSLIAASLGLGENSLALLAQMPTSEISAVVSAIDEVRIYCLCAAGGIGGGMISILVFPLKGNIKTMAAKMSVGVISAVMFSPVIIFYPMVLKYTEFLTITFKVIIISGFVSMFSWGVFQELLPLSGKIGMKIIRYIFRFKDD